MQCIKIKKIIDNLTKNYYPFNLLTEERAIEVTNMVRFIEMHKGEIFQICGGTDNDYLFVIEGRIELVQCGSVRTVASSAETRKKPLILPIRPNTSTIVARENSIICHADRQMLDDLIAWDEILHITEETDKVIYHRMELVRNSLVFRRLPMECVEEAFKRMEEEAVKKDEQVITQGESGDAYYIIMEGEAHIYETGLYDDSPQKTAILGVGDAFGGEALVSGGIRNETVRMSEDGYLLVLHKSDFDELIGQELVKHVNANIAKTMSESGYHLIDVRYPEEYDEYHIPKCILMPLYELNSRLNELSKADKYITYCHSGARSKVAAMILTQHNFDVFTMEGGIRDWPFDTESNE